MKKHLSLFVFMACMLGAQHTVHAQTSGYATFTDRVYVNQCSPVIGYQQDTNGKRTIGYSVLTPSFSTTNVDSVYYITQRESGSTITKSDSCITQLTAFNVQGFVQLKMGLTVTDTLHDSVFVYVNRSKTAAYKAKVTKGENPISFIFEPWASVGRNVHISAYCKLKAFSGSAVSIVEHWNFSEIDW